MTVIPDNILFDLDGTLTDPKEGIINSYIYALNKLQLKESNPEAIVDYFGAPLHKYFEEKHGLDNDKLDSAIKYYREYYSDKGLYENRIFDGIEKLIKNLI